jgi:hypothetical protein
MTDQKNRLDDIELTDRELLVAKAAAKMAVREMQDEFYRQVGKSVVTRVLVFVGIAAVAFAAGRGWIRAIG